MIKYVCQKLLYYGFLSRKVFLERLNLFGNFKVNTNILVDSSCDLKEVISPRGGDYEITPINWKYKKGRIRINKNG